MISPLSWWRCHCRRCIPGRLPGTLAYVPSVLRYFPRIRKRTGASTGENKTRATGTSVRAFLKKVNDPRIQQDCRTLIAMQESISHLKPVTWGSAIIGFGTLHYVYAGGREGDTMIVGFFPRKQAIVLYLAGGLEPLKKERSDLGKQTTGKVCLYLKSLGGVSAAVRKKILTKSYRSGLQ
jgi:hypothetical protein